MLVTLEFKTVIISFTLQSAQDEGVVMYGYEMRSRTLRMYENKRTDI
jgi:hypothetical protein